MRWKFWRKRKRGTGIPYSRTFWFRVGAQLQLDHYDEHAPMDGVVVSKGGNHINVIKSGLEE